jgi:bifunctional DNA-binding transcriptional regulator/antitoxin component of YhaV-PrlF toxin-antitoxin module
VASIRTQGGSLSTANQLFDLQIMSTASLSESRVSTGFLTVIPKEVRLATGVQKGDKLVWQLRGAEILIRVRRRRRIEDLVGIGSHGGDAVASKKAVQGMDAHVR